MSGSEPESLEKDSMQSADISDRKISMQMADISE